MRKWVFIILFFLTHTSIVFSQENVGDEFEEEYLGEFLEDEDLSEDSKKSTPSQTFDNEVDLDSIELDNENFETSSKQLPVKTSTVNNSDSFDSFDGNDFTKNSVQEIQFYSNKHGGITVITMKSFAAYRKRTDRSKKQIFIELPGIDIPKQLRRPYITSGFQTSIGSINAYQPKGSKQGVIVFQMKNNDDLHIQQRGNRLYVKPTIPVDGNLGNGFGGNGDDEVKFTGKLIGIEVNDETPIADIMRLISAQSGANIITDSEVTGKYGVSLKQLPWDQVLTLVLKANNLGYQRHGNVLRVTTQEKLQREADNLKKIAEAKAQSIPLVFEVLTVSYAKVTDLEKQLKPFLSKRGNISSDARTSSLMINDLPINVKQIAKLVRSLDTAPPQVLIEGKVIEAQEDFSKSLGVNWGFSGDPLEVGNSGGLPVNLTPSLDVASSTSGGNLSLNLNIGTLSLIGDLTSQLSLSERESKIKIISSPRVLATTNVKASINDTTQIPLIQQRADDNGGITSTIDFKNVQLELVVTPQVTADNSIILDVDLSRDFAGAIVDQASQARPINTRKAKSTVLVKNGETAVLGGIYQTDLSESEEGVPYLRNVPILGRLFESTTSTKERKELMIFLTPRIITANR